MIVVGGAYKERCWYPHWDRIFGSGLRAALAVSKISKNSELYTFADPSLEEDIKATLGAFGVRSHITHVRGRIIAEYLYPLGQVDLFSEGTDMPGGLSLNASGNVALSFGLIEGTAKLEAKFIIHDPQSELVRPDSHVNEQFRPERFITDNLTVILGESDFPGEKNSRSQIDYVRGKYRAKILVSRRRAGGATVYIGDSEPQEVPAYEAQSFFKIGTGDVFAAAYAHYWAERGFGPVEAADIASRCMSYFADGGAIPLPCHTALGDMNRINTYNVMQKIYIAGAVKHLPIGWLATEASEKLRKLGADTFWPVRDVDVEISPGRMSSQNLDGMDDCSAVLALADDANEELISEIDYARKRGIPIVIYSASVPYQKLVDRYGNGPDYQHDFTSALYRVRWASIRDNV